MSKANSPTKLRRRHVEHLTKHAVYDSEGTIEYSDFINPHTDIFEFERYKRFYIRWFNFYHHMEREFDHMAEMYGEFRPNKLKQFYEYNIRTVSCS